MKKGVLLFTLVLLSACKIATDTVILPEEEFLIIAHRGASAYAPDHSLLAYELAAGMQADYIELDVQMTEDGELISFHDRIVELPGGKKEVVKTTLHELEQVKRKTDYAGIIPVSLQTDADPLGIVTTEEVFTHFGSDVNYYIELKSPASYPGMEDKLLQQLHKHGLLTTSKELPKVILQSFDANVLKKIHELEPTIPLIQLYSVKNGTMPTKKQLSKVAAYASGIGINEGAVTKEFVERVHKESLHIHPFTVNDEKSIQRMIDLGVNGIFTDVPDIAMRILEEESE